MSTPGWSEPETGTPDTSTLPHKYPVVQTFERLKAAFPAINDECKGCHETYRVKNS